MTRGDRGPRRAPRLVRACSGTGGAARATTLAPLAGQPSAALVTIGALRPSHRSQNHVAQKFRCATISAMEWLAPGTRRPASAAVRPSRALAGGMCARVSISSSRTAMAPNGTTRTQGGQGSLPSQGIIYRMPRVSTLIIAVLLACAGCTASATAPNVRRHHPRRDGLRRHRIARPPRGHRHHGRPYRARRRPVHRVGKDDDRCHWPGRRTRLHQHAVLVDRVAARRRTFSGRHPAGCHTRNLRRRELDGSAQRHHEEAHGRGDGRHQVRHHVDDPRGVSPGARAPRRLDQRGLVHWRHDDSRARDRTRGQETDTAAARRDAGARQAGDGGRGARHRQLAHLRAGLLCLDRGVDRALQGRGAVSGQIHFAPAERGQSSPRGHRGTDSHQPRREHSGGDLSPQGRRQGQLGQDRRRDRDGRESPGPGAEDHRRHVQLPRRRDRTRRRDAAVGPRRWLQRGVQATRGPGDPEEDRARDHHAVERLGEPLPRRGLPGPCTARGVQVRGAQAAHRQEPGGSRRTARRIRARHDHEPRARRPLARGDGVLHDVGGQHPQADPAAMGVVRIGRGVDGAGAAVHEVIRAPARLRERRQAARAIRARGEGHPARRGRAAAVGTSRDQPRTRSTRFHPGRHVRRCRRLRSRADCR